MRARRIARCIERASVALVSGNRDAVDAALAEARALDPASPDLLAFEARLQERGSDSAAPVAPRRRPSLAIGVASAAAVIATAAFGAWKLTRPTVDEPRPPVTVAASAAPSPAAPPRRVTPSLRIEHETIVALDQVPTIVGTVGEVAADRSPAAEVDDEPVTASMSEEPSRDRVPAEAVPAAPLQMASAPDQLPAAMLPVVPPPAANPVSAGATSASVNPAPAPVPEPRRPPDPRPEPADSATAARVDPRDQVIQVLNRYEAAYSQLDAQAARAVWPTVDEKALARAFDGLASQDVSLGRCDVEVQGQVARAHCRGTAKWTPKIGGGVKTQARRWEFQLAQADSGWEIVKAGVR